jgi:hypothetical protein
MAKLTAYCPFHYENVGGEQTWPEFLTGVESGVPETSENPQNGKWYQLKHEAKSTADGLIIFDEKQKWQLATITIELPEPEPDSFPGATNL